MDRKHLALRIGVVFAIAALVAVFAIAWLEIRPRMQTLSKERDALNSASELNRARANKAEAFARELAARLADAEARTASALHTNKATADRNTRLLVDVEEIRATLHTTRQELARWNAIGATPDQIASLARDNKNLATQIDQLQTNNDRLARDNANLQRILTVPTDPDAPPQLPPMRGSVLVVDPKWDFVVLDLGETNGLLKDGVLIISRDGKLIGKVKVRHVGPDRSIADIVPGLRTAEVREGDQVMN